MLPLRYGIVGGLGLIAYLAALYFIDKTLLVEGWEKITWLLLLGLMIAVAVARRRQEKDAFIPFRPLLQTTYQTFIIAYLMKFFAIYVLFRYVDAELMEMARLAEIQIVIEMRNPDVTDLVFEKQLEAYKTGDFGPRLFDLGVMLELIFGAILAAITSSILRRDSPYYQS